MSRLSGRWNFTLSKLAEHGLTGVKRDEFYSTDRDHKAVIAQMFFTGNGSWFVEDHERNTIRISAEGYRVLKHGEP